MLPKLGFIYKKKTMNTTNTSERILIAEDSPDNLNLLSQMLNEHGYKVLTAKTGSEAIASINAELPGIILLDINLPDISGYEVCTSLKADAKTSDIPILFLNSSNETEDKLRGFEVGGADFITQPFIKEEILARIRSHLEIGRQRVELKHKAAELDLLNKRLQAEAAERKQAEAKLNDETIRRGILCEQLPEGIVVIDPETTGFIEFNTAAHTQLGYTREEFAELSIADIQVEETKEEIRAEIERVIKEGRNDFETLQRTKDGKIRNISVIAQYIDNPRHSIYHCLWRDITERKIAEKKLRESELRLEQVSEGARQWIWEVDTNGVYTYVNPIVKDLLGYDPGELIGIKHFYDLFEPEHREEYKKEAFEAIARKEIVRDFTNCNIHKDGRRVMLSTHAFPILDGENNLTGYRGIDVDITERLLIEETLRESEKKYRSVLDSANDAIITIDSLGIIRNLNPGTERIFGYTKEEIIGKNVVIIIPQDYRESHINGMKLLNIGGGHKAIGDTVELSGLRKSGREFPIELSLAEWETSKEKFFTGIIRDISLRKKADEEIKERNEQLIKLNAEKDKFFSIIAHDLKSPFNGFLILTELMADSSVEFSLAEFAENSKLLNEAARNLYKLLGNLLEWAQIQKGSINFNPKDSNLSKMVSQSIETIYQRALQKRIEIITEIDNTQKVYADDKMIDTVLRNLLSNAVKFTRKDGKTVVKSKLLNDTTVEVSVEDNGVGMPAKDVERLFNIEEKVSSVGTEGELSTGLGLLLCKEFIEMNGGKIWAESELGKGSKFTFTLHKSNINPA